MTPVRITPSAEYLVPLYLAHAVIRTTPGLALFSLSGTGCPPTKSSYWGSDQAAAIVDLHKMLTSIVESSRKPL